MGLAVRVIPTLLCRGRTLVKGKRFHSWRSVGVVAQAVRIHQARGVDELVLLEIGTSTERRKPDLALIEELTAGCFMPLAVGGGIDTVEDVRNVLRAGADKVVICSASLRLIEAAAAVVGSQAIVAAIDYGKDTRAYVYGGRGETGQVAMGLARLYAGNGAGEILLTSMEREGMMEGYDTSLIQHMSREVGIPVIAHGGCGTYGHMHEALKAGASAVAAGAMFQFTDATPKGAAEYLASKGHEVRL